MTQSPAKQADQLHKDAPLALERLAEVLAHKRSYAPMLHPKVLEKLGVSAADLDGAAAYWARVLAVAFQQGEVEPLLQFTRLYSRIERRVRERPIPIGQLRPDPDLVSARKAASFPKRTMKPLDRKPAASDPGRAAEPVREQLPSYLREDSRPVALAAQPMPSPNVSRPFVEPDPDDTARVDPAALEKAQGVPFSPDSPAARAHS
jgi:hypothetical protein